MVPKFFRLENVGVLAFMTLQNHDDGSKTIYRRVLSSAQEKLAAAINQIRHSIPHSGEIGSLIERQFRTQLEEIMPEKIGVSHGFVVDSTNQVSKQMDIILYDKHNTPRIFASDGAQMFPVEATYACGEIKTVLNSKNLDDSFQKCFSYKRLCRKAYINHSNPITNSYSLFGCNHDHWQSIFFCLAVESINPQVLTQKYNEIVSGGKLAVHQRVDTIAALEGGDGYNVLLNISGDDRNHVPSDKSIDLLPSPGSKLWCYRATEPWALFSALLLRYMTQAPTEPISMLPYYGNTPY